MTSSDTVETKSYEWLSPQAKLKVNGSLYDRIAFIRNEHFVRHGKMQKALKAMQYVYTQPRKRRMECVLIVGPSGAGKTIAVKNFLKTLGIETEDDGFYVRITNGRALVVVLDLAGAWSEQDVLNRIAAACVGRGEAKGNYSKEVVLRLLIDLGTRVLIWDEADQLAGIDDGDLERILATIRDLTNNAQIGLILLGTRKLESIIRGDDTITQRFSDDVFLTPLSDPTQLAEFVLNFIKRMPLRNPPRIDGKCLSLISRHTGGRQPRVVSLLIAATIHAILDLTECLNRDSLKKAIDDPHPEIPGELRDEEAAA